MLAPVYDRLIEPLERRGLRQWRARTWAEVPQQGRGLELGFGTGANLPFHAGRQLVGLDVAPAMLRRARGKPGAAEAPLVAGDAQALPFADATFDWVAETLVFCEVPDPVRGLREARRVLRPGGRLVMLEHVRPPGLLGAAADALTLLTGPTVGEHWNRRPERSLEQAGFTLLGRTSLWRRVVVLLVAEA